MCVGNQLGNYIYMAFPCNKVQILWRLLPLLIIFTITTLSDVAEAENEKILINVGGIVNLNTRIGQEQKAAMRIAAEKFNSLSNTHRLIPHFRHSDRDPLVAAFAAEELIKDKRVRVIVGMETWQEAALVADAGNRAQIPVISFASPTIAPPLIQHDWPFLIRVASDRAAQMKCIADLVSLYTWKRVIVIYQDDGYGGDSGMLALLSEALHNVGSKIEHHLVLPRVSSLSNPSWGELEQMLKLPTFQSRVFIVLQASFQAVTNLFRVAKKMGLVERDSAWIITESVTSLLESQVINHDMEGTLGIKTFYATNTSSYANFEKVFQTKFPQEDNSKPGIYALRAYDIMEIVAQAIRKTTNSSTTNLQVLLNTVVNEHMGLSGKMQLKRGEVLLNTPTFRIINIVRVVKGDKCKELDFWVPEFGFSKSLRREESKNKTNDVGTVVWPGNTERAPKGWGMPTVQKPLRIVVPASTSFSAFVKVDLSNNPPQYDGFCIQIFHKVRGLLDYPLHYEFYAVNGSYDDLVELVHNKTYDAGVGDFTVRADRLDKVEFTYPYMESGVAMIVQQENEQVTWLFLAPLTWQMWAATGAVLVYTILIIWLLERRSNPEFSGPLKNQIGTATWFTFTSLFFSQREKIHNNLTRVVVVMWLFVVFILTSSYTANLSSMLTVHRLKPSVTDIETLKRTNSKVGLEEDTFVKDYLEQVVQFNPKDIIKLSNEYNYTEAFRDKSISAAFIELPYAKVYMSHFCKGYTITTPTFRFGGFGFIFQKGSPIARDFTKAILQLLEDGELKSLEDTWLPSNRYCPNNTSSDVPESLRVKNFMALYVISSATSTICLLVSFTILLKKFQQHQEAYLGNASDESVWNRTVRIARFLYNREFNVPISRATSFVDVLELTSFQGEHVTTSTPQEVEDSTPAQNEGSPPHS